MNTLISISVNSNEAKVRIENAIDEALSKFDYVVNKFSRFNSQSELSKVNKSQSIWIVVSDELYYLIDRALQGYKESEGLFDPTIIDLLSAYGYDKSFDEARIATKLQNESFIEEIKTLLQKRPHPDKIQLNMKQHSIKLEKHQKLDLGGLAKGHAIDLAKEVLINKGFNDFIINAGGDIWVNSTKRVALFNPTTSNNPFFFVTLKDKAVAGSGSSARKVGFFHHILNPQTGAPENKLLQTYVIANTAIEADLYATVLFLLGEKGLDLIHEKGLKGVLLTDEGISGDTDIIS